MKYVYFTTCCKCNIVMLSFLLEKIKYLEKKDEENFITGIVEGYKDTFWLTSQGGLIEYNIETGQSKVYTYQDDEKFVSYFSCLALLKEKAIFRNGRQWYACF